MASPHPEQQEPESASEHATYLRFGAMIATSVAVMYALTYANVFVVDHIEFSEMRVYMALLMGAAMAVVMLGWMWGMYRDMRINVAIIGASVALGIVALFLARSQALVDDTDYMRAMIPHHSIAILTSERAGIEDRRVRELAREITEAQRREIAEMQWLIADIEAHGAARTDAEAEDRPVPSFSGDGAGRAGPLAGRAIGLVSWRSNHCERGSPCPPEDSSSSWLRWPCC